MHEASSVRRPTRGRILILLILGAAIWAVTSSWGSAGAQEQPDRPVAAHDEPQQALRLDGTGRFIDHPDRVATTAGEGAGFDCFDGPALWYRTYLAGPVAVAGSGQDIAVYASPDEPITDLQDLHPLECITNANEDITAATVLPVTEWVYLAVSVRDGALPFTIVNDLDLTTEVICRDDGTADVTYQIVNLTDQTRDLSLVISSFEKDSRNLLVAPRSTAQVEQRVVRDTVISVTLTDGDRFAWATVPVDCRPNSAPNETVSGAFNVELTPTSTILNADRVPTDWLNGTSGRQLGEIDRLCFDEAGAVWYSFVATQTSTGFTGSDDQDLAVFRSPVDSPQSVADLQKIACAEPEDDLSFPTTPGETIYVAIGEDPHQTVHVTDPTWTVAFSYCFEGVGSMGVASGRHDASEPLLEAELRSVDGAYAEVSPGPRSLSFIDLPDGTYELTVREIDGGADFVPPEEIVIDCHPTVANDTPAGALRVGSGAISLHPDQEATRDGEVGLSCFGGAGSWYTVGLAVPGVIVGYGQDIAVFTSDVDPQSMEDLDEVGCYQRLDGASDALLAPIDGGHGRYYVAVSSEGGNRPWRFVSDLAVIADVSCSADGMSSLTVRVINSTERSEGFEVVIEAGGETTTFTGIIAANSTRPLFVSPSVPDGHVLVRLNRNPGRFVGTERITVDCRDDGVPERPQNDEISRARYAYGQGTTIQIHEGSEAEGFASLAPGELGDCFVGGTTWHRIYTSGDTLSLHARDEQTLAVYRGATYSPNSLGDVELVACGDESIINLETSPGEWLFVALSGSQRGDVWVSGEQYAYVDVGPDSCRLGLRTTLVVGNDATDSITYRATAHDESGTQVWTQVFDLAAGQGDGADLDTLLGDGSYTIDVVDVDTNRVVLEPTEVTIYCEAVGIDVRTEARLEGSPKPVAYLDFIGNVPADAVEWRVINPPGFTVGEGEFGQVGIFPADGFVGSRLVLVHAYADGEYLDDAVIRVEVVGYTADDVVEEFDIPFGLHSLVGQSVDEIDLSYLPWRSDNAVWGATGLPPGVHLEHDDDRFWFRGAPSAPGIFPVRICNDWLGPEPTCATVLEFDWRVPALSPEVNHHVSCLDGKGRVDTTIINPLPPEDRAEYELQFPGLTRRVRTGDGGDWIRMPITARADGDYLVRVLRDGTEVSAQTITVDCDDSPTVSDDEVTVIVSCRAGLGYILIQLVNPTAQPRGYVIEFADLRNRSQTAQPYGQALRSVTGRPAGTYDVAVRVGSTIIYNKPVTVQCA